jgi:hypothetical protein
MGIVRWTQARTGQIRTRALPEPPVTGSSLSSSLQLSPIINPLPRCAALVSPPLWHAYNWIGILSAVVEFAIAARRLEELFWVEKVWEDLVH